MRCVVYSVKSVKVEELIGVPENPRAISVTAKGMVTTTGWTEADLSPRSYVMPPEDGILDLDFTAVAPTGHALQVLTEIEPDEPVELSVPDWVAGVRVHSSTNHIESKIPGFVPGEDVEWPTDDEVLPWPWWGPQAKK